MLPLTLTPSSGAQILSVEGILYQGGREAAKWQNTCVFILKFN